MSLSNMMYRKVKEINFEKLNKLAADIAKRNNKSVFYVKMDMIKNFLQYGIGYTDYLKSDYINLSKEQKKTYVTTKSYYKILKYLNNNEYKATMADKVIFNKIFKDYLGREWIDLEVSTLEQFKEFVKNKENVFAKLPNDFGAHGIRKIVVKNENLDALYTELKEKGLFLIEEEIIQHEELNKLNPFAVNPYRLVTLVKDGKAYLMADALRINIDDDIAVGCNDAYMRLGEDGKICSNVIDDYANIYTEHPIKKVKFDTVTIPFVKESWELALKAALEVPEVRYVGWDIAITNNGPVIMEGNEYPSYGLVQYYLFNNKHEGHLKQIADILGDEMEKIKL